MPFFGLLGQTPSVNRPVNAGVSKRSGRRRGGGGPSGAVAGSTRSRLHRTSRVSAEPDHSSDSDEDTPDHEDSCQVTTVEEVAVTIERVMDSWLDPCGSQYAPVRKPVQWSASRDTATLEWSGFDRLDARKLAALRNIALGRFRVDNVQANFESSTVILTVVSGICDNRTRATGGSGQGAAAGTPEERQASAADVMELREIRNRWGPIDTEDMDRIMTAIRTVRSYIRALPSSDPAAPKFSYDLFKKYTAFDVLVKGFHTLTCDFLLHLIEKNGQPNEDAVGKEIQLWIDFESSCLVIEIVKHKIPID